MEGKDQTGERTFRVTFGEEGAEKLGVRLTEELKEYMGEYVDDTLVKYVIVLLGNGRSKEEVKEELDVFLGDSTDDFVTWLWDHLGSQLDQYVQPHKSHAVEVEKTELELVEHVDKNVSHNMIINSEGGKSNKTSKSRHNRDWKGLVTDVAHPPPLRSSITGHVPNEEKARRNPLCSTKSISPEHHVHRKRNRPEDRSQLMREVSAPRRLLQFAVREAVATINPSNAALDPAKKRLRSVVSTSTGHSTEEVHPRRLESVARLTNPITTAIKAVAMTSEDVRKIRTKNVFDRLSSSTDVQENIEQISTFRGPSVEDDEYVDYEPIDEKRHQRYLHTRGYVGGYNVNASTIDSTGMDSDSASHNKGFGNFNVRDYKKTNGTETDYSREYKVDDSYTVDSSVAQRTVEVAHQTQKDSEQPVSVGYAKPKKIVNISVNVNTWKPPHYQPPREIIEIETRKSTLDTVTKPGKSSLHMKENNNRHTGHGHGKPAADTQKENQQTSATGSYSTVNPSEDADSRTIFVNNVHFAATKDSLSRHFNKFGEVLKVIILTDAATGHPRGSAYVEFTKKEAAENALSLDGTSFMSRIIKVVKKSSGLQETSITVAWPRITRGSPFSVPRFAQTPFSRGFSSGGYRARAPIKAGARSMQWKRDAQQTATATAATVVPASGISSNPVAAGRGFTYIRSESKSNVKTEGV